MGLNAYKKNQNEYKYRLRKVKEETWRHFVSAYSNLDPWGVVYKVCRGKKVRQYLSSLKLELR